MSWGLFASNMKRYMANPIGVASLQVFAKKLTMEYDACIRRGIQGINLCSIQKGNTQLMEALTIVALLKCFALQKPGKPLPTSPILKELGNAVKGYWTGATLNPFPIPPIPAPGAIQNIVVTNNLCINPGTWIVQFELPPVESPNFFINSFILVSQIHLLTLKGMIYTTSMYPAAPSPVPAPGVINWSGYVVPGGRLPGLGGDDSGDSTATSDWQTLSALPSNTTPKKFSPNEVYNTGDIIESAGKFYLAQNPEKNGLRCWNIPF